MDGCTRKDANVTATPGVYIFQWTRVANLHTKDMIIISSLVVI
jgi:hypothetical protein